jgi:hypothetical protein
MSCYFFPRKFAATLATQPTVALLVMVVKDTQIVASSIVPALLFASVNLPIMALELLPPR